MIIYLLIRGSAVQVRAQEQEKPDISKYRAFLFVGAKFDIINGDGANYSTLFREYNPIIGRWWSIDPLRAKYAGMSPYNYAVGNPINFVDRDGLHPEKPFKTLEAAYRDFSVDYGTHSIYNNVEISTRYYYRFDKNGNKEWTFAEPNTFGRSARCIANPALSTIEKDGWIYAGIIEHSHGADSRIKEKPNFFSGRDLETAKMTKEISILIGPGGFTRIFDPNAPTGERFNSYTYPETPNDTKSRYGMLQDIITISPGEDPDPLPLWTREMMYRIDENGKRVLDGFKNVRRIPDIRKEKYDLYKDDTKRDGYEGE